MEDFSAFWNQQAFVPQIVNFASDSLGLSVSGDRFFWTLSQIGLVLLCLSLGFICAHLFVPKLENALRTSSFNASTLRIFAVLLRRLHLIFAGLFLWLVEFGLRSSTQVNGFQFVSLCAALFTAYAVISIVSRVIRNKSLSRIVEIGAWILVSLMLLGILPEAIAALDAAAFQLNDLRISLLTLIQGAFILTVLIWGAGYVSKRLEVGLANFEGMTPSARVLIGKVARFGLIILAVVSGLYTVGIDLAALTFISGAVGIGLGFGLQKVVSNLVSGIILLMDKSIKPGDVITVGDTFGWITSLNARYASVSMRDGREILIPNEDLITQQVQNWSFDDPYVRVEINFGVSYKSDLRLVKQIAIDAAKSVPRVVTDTGEFPVACHVTAFGDSSVDFTLRFFISDPANGITNVRGDVYLAVWDVFADNNVSIPYPHREVILNQN